MSDQSEKTEKPSAKKLKDARDKGQIARSRDLAVASASVAATIALARLGGTLWNGLGERMAADLGHFGDAPMHTITGGELTRFVMQGGLLVATLVAPFALTTMITGVVVHGFQGGWSFAPGALQLNWSRLNPANNAKRLGISGSGADTLKTMVSVAAIAWLAWGVLKRIVFEAPQLAWTSPLGTAAAGWHYAEELLWNVAIALGVLSMGDYALQYYRHWSSLKMTKQEARDEGKEADGNPEVKGRMRKMRAEMSRRRMIADVKKATVVITNPTHYAIAIEYRRGSMPAPVVRAKGVDHLAAVIRQKARDHGVPIVENKPLAQALYKTAEIGETIPGPLFAATAEVLAQLIRLKQLVL
jgi:flagellar biosynthesis protein FlhB